MFCTTCGNQVTVDLTTCPNCGGNLKTQPGAAVLQIQPRFKMSKLYIWVYSIVAGILVLGSIGMATLSKDNGLELVKLIVNWLLAIAGLFSVLGIIVGVILGIVFLIKADHEPAYRSHYNSNALWSFLGPILLTIVVIMSYVIINVVYKLK